MRRYRPRSPTPATQHLEPGSAEDQGFPPWLLYGGMALLLGLLALFSHNTSPQPKLQPANQEYPLGLPGNDISSYPLPSRLPDSPIVIIVFSSGSMEEGVSLTSLPSIAELMAANPGTIAPATDVLYCQPYSP